MDDEQKINALIRFTNDASDRLEAIQKLADALTDGLCGDHWSLAFAIQKLAEGKWDIDEAHQFIDGDEA